VVKIKDQRRGEVSSEKKEVNKVIEFAVELGWTVVYGSGHVYATLRCPHHDRDGYQVRVHSTPQNTGNHANKLLNDIQKCPHQHADKTEEEEET
jgi:hypothetical protein